jgi:hypothetical protein
MPMIAADGWYKIMSRHPAFNGIEIEFSEEIQKIGAVEAPKWCRVKLHRKDAEFPVEILEYFKENYRTNSNPWAKMPARMLRHRAAIQAIRLAFGVSCAADVSDEGVDSVNAFNGNSARKSTVQVVSVPASKSGQAQASAQASPEGGASDFGLTPEEQQRLDGFIKQAQANPAWDARGWATRKVEPRLQPAYFARLDQLADSKASSAAPGNPTVLMLDEKDAAAPAGKPAAKAKVQQAQAN